MSKENLAIAENYYAAMKRKDIETMEALISPTIRFVGPLAELEGKTAVLRAIQGFLSAFETLSIRSKFHSDGEVMLAMDTVFPAPIGNLRTASLLSIQNGLIQKIELFYDSRIVESKKDEVFSQ